MFRCGWDVAGGIGRHNKGGYLRASSGLGRVIPHFLKETRKLFEKNLGLSRFSNYFRRFISILAMVPILPFIHASIDRALEVTVNHPTSSNFKPTRMFLHATHT